MMCLMFLVRHRLACLCEVRLPKSEFSADFGSDPEKARRDKTGKGALGRCRRRRACHGSTYSRWGLDFRSLFRPLACHSNPSSSLHAYKHKLDWPGDPWWEDKSSQAWVATSAVANMRMKQVFSNE